MAPLPLKLAVLGAASILFAHHKGKGQESTPRLVILEPALYFIVSIVLLILWSCYIYPSLFSPLRHIPKADLGWRHSLYQWLYTEPEPPRLAQAFNTVPNNGLLRYTGIGGGEQVLAADAEIAREVLVSGCYDPFVRPLLSRQKLAFLTGRGLLAVEGEEHKNSRRKLLPAFSFRAIKNLSPLFWEKACQMAELLGDVTDSAGSSTEKSDHGVSLPAEIDITSWATRTTLDVIGVAVWGNDFGALHDSQSEDDDFLKAYAQLHPSPATSAIGNVIGSLALVVPISLLQRLPLKRNEELRTAVTAVRERCAAAVKQRRLEKNVESRNDILSVAMNSGAFDDTQLVDHLMTMLAAGHDTSSIALTWTCYQLCFYPEMQTRLRNEIRASLPSPSSGEAVDSSQLEALTYLRAVCNEVLRLWPPVPTVRRAATHDTVLKGQAIPSGTSLTVTSIVTNRIKSTWGEDAENFDPDRWMKPGQEGNGGAKSNFDFQTFSQGPRACTGQGFARAEMLALVAAMFGRFEVALVNEGVPPVIDYLITMNPRNGLRLKIKRVPGW